VQNLSPNEKITDNPLLLEACKKGQLERVKELIAQGADVNAKRNDGVTILMQACAVLEGIWILSKNSLLMERMSMQKQKTAPLL
jgi:hypothetical protein